MTMMLLSQIAPGRRIEPAQLSHEMRHGRDRELRRRRAVIGLALVGAGAMAVVSMYQTGILRHLPEPRLPYLDAEKVDASDEAYAHLAAPDGLLGLTSYAMTATLASMGGEHRATRRPWLSAAFVGKVIADAVVAAKLTFDQWHKHRAFCSYCLIGAAASFAMLPLVASEAREAVRALRRRYA